MRRLESRYSRRASGLAIGVYWALWHIPLWLVTVTWAGDLIAEVLLIAAINTVALSVFFAFLYHRSGQSLPVVIVLHLMCNMMTTQVSAVIWDHQVLLIAISTLFTVCLAVAIAKWGRWEDGARAVPEGEPTTG